MTELTGDLAGPALAVGGLPRSRSTRRGRVGSMVRSLGPAFVAAVAYVDPGNVAANLGAGAAHGYLLIWVLLLANPVAMLVQYLAAKLGLATGMNLAEHVAGRLSRRGRRAYWAQAELVTAATDIAEVVGGALALHLLLGLPLVVGGVLVGGLSLLLLTLRSGGQRRFEVAVVALLAVVAGGLLAGLTRVDVDWFGAAAGAVPQLAGTDTVLLAASMFGATVMPHAVYLHSALVVDRHGRPAAARLRQLLKATRWDVGLALVVAGAVNVGMVLLAAATLQGVPGADSIEGAHAAFGQLLGPATAVAFAVGLLASSLASTAVGAQAGAIVMAGLLRVRMRLLTRRVLTVLPALVLLGLGVSPTWALIASQVVLSLGICFALVPLVRLTSDARVMGGHVNTRLTTAGAVLAATCVLALNVVLVVSLLF